MPYKIVEVGGKKYAELGENDNAIFVHSDGTEAPFDAEGATSRIAALNAEQANRRHENNDLKNRLKAFEGIDDPDKARDALKTVEGLSAGELKTAAQVNEIKDAAKKSAEAQVAEAQRKATNDLLEANKKLETLESQLHEEKIGGGFARSKFIAEKVAVPADMMQKFFGQYFKIEDGQTVAYGPGGEKLYSKTRAGEIATIDEALEQLVASYPNKEYILKGTGGGSGGGPGAADRGGLNKADFDKLDPVSKMNLARGVRPATQGR